MFYPQQDNTTIPMGGLSSIFPSTERKNTQNYQLLLTDAQLESLRIAWHYSETRQIEVNPKQQQWQFQDNH
jgi:hypothetical protein